MDIQAEIIAIERAALDRWSKGDPSAFLDLSDPDVVYFDPFVDRRLNGIAALTALYDSLRGTFQIEHYEMIDPRVQVCGDAAVLTYNFSDWINKQQQRWNCTEVYRKNAKGQWRIIQTHWSFTKAGQAAATAQ